MIYVSPYAHRVAIDTVDNPNLKGVRAKLQKSCKQYGIYGLNFWHDATISKSNYQEFTVLSPYGPQYIRAQLTRFKREVNQHGI